MVGYDKDYRSKIWDESRDIYPIELIKTGCSIVKNMTLLGPEKGFYRYDTQRAMILYTFRKIDGKFLPLNREYKPLGLLFYGGKVDYRDFPFLLIPKERINFDEMPKKISSFNHETGLEHAYMFDDGCYPRGKSKKTYLEAIERVFSIKLYFREHY